MERLIQLHPLRKGAHPRRADGMCTMEMVAWLAGEPHSDEPKCSCPVIAAYVRAVNDALPSDSVRNRYLRPLVPKLVNTRRTADIERRRGFLVADAVARTFVPLLLDHSGRRTEAQLLRALPVVVDRDTAKVAARALEVWAQEQHPARWLLQRAGEGCPPARYVAAAVHVIRHAGMVDAWTRAVSLATVMAALGQNADREHEAVGGAD